MGLLSRFRNPAPQPAAEAGGGGTAEAMAGAWRKTDFITFSAGEETHVVYTRVGPPTTLPAFAVEFVLSCHAFEPLATHLARYADRHGWHSLQVDALRRELPRIIATGALVSVSDVRRRCAEMPKGEPPPPIGAIGFPTGGDRGPLLARAIESFAANLRAHGRSAEFIVADGSEPAAYRAALRARAASLSRAVELPVCYCGAEERRRFAGELIRRSGCHPDAVEFALFDPLGLGFSCGANRNALLLHEAGRMFCSVDDDVVCQLAEPPELRAVRLSMFSNGDPFSRWLFADRASALAAARPVARDFLGAHEELLGRRIGAFFDPAPGGDQLDLAKAGDDLLRRLEGGDARVCTTFCGHVGDPGIPSSVNFLYYDRDNFRRLVASEAHYRSVFGSRSVLTSVLARSIGDASVSPGMAMGLDHRELLPPFFPVLHAEDFAFGMAVWQCCPGAVAGHQPLAILHDPPPGKPILQPRDFGPDNRVVLFEFAFVLWRVIVDFDPPQSAGAATRIAALGRHLSEWAARPFPDFVAVLRETLLQHQSEKLGHLEALLRDRHDAPDYWRDDVEAFLQHARAALSAEDFDIPYDLKAGRKPEEARRLMQQLVARYGQLLQDWPAMVATARELRAADQTLAVRV